MDARKNPVSERLAEQLPFRFTSTNLPVYCDKIIAPHAKEVNNGRRASRASQKSGTMSLALRRERVAQPKELARSACQNDNWLRRAQKQRRNPWSARSRFRSLRPQHDTQWNFCETLRRRSSALVKLLYCLYNSVVRRCYEHGADRLMILLEALNVRYQVTGYIGSGCV